MFEFVCCAKYNTTLPSTLCFSFGLYVFKEMVVGNLNWTIAAQQLNNSHFNYKSITSSAALFRLMDQGLLHFLLGKELIKTHTELIKSVGLLIDTQQGVKQTLSHWLFILPRFFYTSFPTIYLPNDYGYKYIFWRTYKSQGKEIMNIGGPHCLVVKTRAMKSNVPGSSPDSISI